MPEFMDLDVTGTMTATKAQAHPGKGYTEKGAPLGVRILLQFHGVRRGADGSSEQADVDVAVPFLTAVLLHERLERALAMALPDAMAERKPPTPPVDQVGDVLDALLAGLIGRAGDNLAGIKIMAEKDAPKKDDNLAERMAARSGMHNPNWDGPQVKAEKDTPKADDK